MSEKKSQEAKKGKPNSAGRRKDSIAKYWLRSPRNKERKVRRVIRRALKLGGTDAAKRVSARGVQDEGGWILKSVLTSGKEQLARWEAARKRRLAASKEAKRVRREVHRAQRIAEREALEALVIAHFGDSSQPAAKTAAKPKPKPKPKKGSQPS